MDHHQAPMQDEPQQIPHQNYYYSGDQQDPAYNMAYNPQMAPYHVVPGQHSQSRPIDLQQQGYQPQLNLIAGQFHSPVYASSPPHVPLPLNSTPPPPSPDMYDPLSPPISGSDTSAESFYQHSNSSGATSPSTSRSNSLVHRSNLRYNPTPSPTSSSGRRSRGHSQDSDEEERMGGLSPYRPHDVAHNRKEATRRQRIEAEQRRRDELRDGYAKLKDVLPVSNQKSSKVNLLERATNHIVSLEKVNTELQNRIVELEQEVQRLRSLNDKIAASNEGTTSAAGGVYDARPLSPPPDAPHPTGPSKGPEPVSKASSPSVSASASASDAGY